MKNSCLDLNPNLGFILLDLRPKWMDFFRKKKS